MGVIQRADALIHLDLSLREAMETAHQHGVNYWDILQETLRLMDVLVLQADIEYQLKGGK